MQSIGKHDVFKLSEEYAEKKFGKKSVDFTDEEEEHYYGYIAGLLKGLRMAGVEVKDL